MDNDELKILKERVLAELREWLPAYRERMDAIDSRIYEYCSDAIREDIDTANIYELLGIRKVLRLMDTYELNEKQTRRVIRAIEGKWDGNRHEAGGLKFDTPRGRMQTDNRPSV